MISRSAPPPLSPSTPAAVDRGTLKQLVRRVFPHRSAHYYDRVFRRTSPARLQEALEAAGVTAGRTIFVHSRLSVFGYHTNGIGGVLRALDDAVGPTGTVLMPSFPFTGSMEDYLARRPVFDVRHTPSTTGALTEAFRRRDGTVRSLHPTHPIAGRGPLARDLLQGHEASETPCGLETPFARLAAADTLFVRLGVSTVTHMHHVQERLDLPNLFLPTVVDVRCVDAAGREQIVRVRPYRKAIWQAFFLSDDADGQRMVVRPRDFPLLSRERDHLYADDPARQAAYTRLRAIRDEFEHAGTLHTAAVHDAWVEGFSARAYEDHFLREGRRLLDAYAHRYDLNALEQLLAAGGYPP